MRGSAIGLLMIPLLKYIHRIIEMRRKSGGWGRVVFRTDVKDRF